MPQQSSAAVAASNPDSFERLSSAREASRLAGGVHRGPGSRCNDHRQACREPQRPQLLESQPGAQHCVPVRRAVQEALYCGGATTLEEALNRRGAGIVVVEIVARQILSGRAILVAAPSQQDRKDRRPIGQVVLQSLLSLGRAGAKAGDLDQAWVEHKRRDATRSALLDLDLGSCCSTGRECHGGQRRLDAGVRLAGSHREHYKCDSKPKHPQQLKARAKPTRDSSGCTCWNQRDARLKQAADCKLEVVTLWEGRQARVVKGRAGPAFELPSAPCLMCSHFHRLYKAFLGNVTRTGGRA